MPHPLVPFISLAMATISAGSNSPVHTTHRLSDRDLYKLISSGGNPLGKFTLAQAVVLDPRRVAALIQQTYEQPFRQIARQAWGGINDRLDEELYVIVMDRIRTMLDGKPTAQALTSYAEMSWYNQLHAIYNNAHPQIRATMLELANQNWGQIQGGFERARQISMQAYEAARARGLNDSNEWREMAKTLSEMEQGWRQLIDQGSLPAPPAHNVIDTPQGPRALLTTSGESFGTMYARGLRHAPPGGHTASSVQGYRGSRY